MKRKREPGSVIRFAVDPDSAAVRFNDSAGDGQTPFRFGRWQTLVGACCDRTYRRRGIGKFRSRTKDACGKRLISPEDWRLCAVTHVGHKACAILRSAASITTLAEELLRTIFLAATSTALSCRFRKPSLQPDLCAPEGLRDNAVSLGQFSLLKKLLLADPWNLRFSIEVNGGNP